MSYVSLHFHIVFSTKERRLLIQDEWRDELHKYLGGTINGLGGVSQQVGDVADHVHLLVGLKATHTLADVVRELKKSSSAWVRDEKRERRFAWQEGYSAFTVSPTARPAVRGYIRNQPEHHRKVSYRDELMGMLKKAGIEYNPQYLD